MLVMNSICALVVQFLVIHVECAFHQGIVEVLFVLLEVLEVKLVDFCDYSFLFAIEGPVILHDVV